MSEITVNNIGQPISLLRENDPSVDIIVMREQREIQEICSAVQNNSNVSIFQIVDCTIDPPAAAAISNAIAKMPLLGWFKLTHCNCGDIESLRVLASSLANKDSLDTLHFIRCHDLGDSGAQLIAASFRGHVNLRLLNLANCDIGVEGAIAVSSLISNNNMILEQIALGDNNINRKGGMALAQSISQNQTLEGLFFDLSNEDRFDIFNALKRAMYNDESIETVMHSNHTLTHTDFEGDGDDDLDSLLHLNRAGREESRRSKIIKFLNKKPRSLLSINFEPTQVPTVLDKIGRVCRINTMFELVRNMPDLFNSPRSRPYRQCRGNGVARLSYR